MERRIKNGEKEWKCDKCEKWFGLDEEWDKNGAIEECGDIWGVEPDDDMPVVCDDCWEEIHPSKHIDLYTQVYETLHKLQNKK